MQCLELSDDDEFGEHHTDCLCDGIAELLADPIMQCLELSDDDEFGEHHTDCLCGGIAELHHFAIADCFFDELSDTTHRHMLTVSYIVTLSQCVWHACCNRHTIDQCEGAPLGHSVAHSFISLSPPSNRPHSRGIFVAFCSRCSRLRVGVVDWIQQEQFFVHSPCFSWLSHLPRWM